MDPLAKVNKHDSPARLLDADRFNILSDVGNWWRRRLGAGQGAGPDAGVQAFPRLEVFVRASFTVPERGIVRLTDTIAELSPVVYPLAAMTQPAFDVGIPETDNDLVVITTAPIQGGTDVVRRAVIIGVTVAEVEHLDEAHQFARPVPGSMFRLQSSDTGPIQLLPDVPGAASIASIRNRLVLLGGSGSTSTAGSGSGSGHGDGQLTTISFEVVTDVTCGGSGSGANAGDLVVTKKVVYITGSNLSVVLRDN